MGWWRKFLALLGLSTDARVKVRAPGIEITITGDPQQVRALLGVVRGELERSHRERRLGSHARPPWHIANIAGVPGPSITSDSQVVRPTDLDEMDSPYAIPEHHTLPPDAPALSEPSTDHNLRASDLKDTEAPGIDDGLEREVTAIERNPSLRPRVQVLSPADSEPTTTPPGDKDTLHGAGASTDPDLGRRRNRGGN